MSNKNDDDFVELPPNFKLMESLCDSGYTLDEALSEIIDNSLDAKASKVQINLPFSGLVGSSYRMIIADNGIGMNQATALEATRLGSNTERTKKDLGCYSVGMKTAVFSFAKRLTIISKMKGEELIAAVSDFDISKEKGKFGAIPGMTPELKSIWNEFSLSKEQGTIILIDKCEPSRFEIIQSKTIIENLSRKLGEKFRYKIMKNSVVKNNKVTEWFLTMRDEKKIIPIYADDPLLRESFSIFMSPELKSKIVGGLSKDIETIEHCYGDVKFTTVFAKDLSKTEKGYRSTQINDQGFFLLRNERQIVGRTTLGLYSAHQMTTKFKVEILFSGEDDTLFGTTFNKRSLGLKSDILSVLKPLAAKTEKFVRSKVITNKDVNMDLTKFEEELSEKFGKKPLIKKQKPPKDPVVNPGPGGNDFIIDPPVDPPVIIDPPPVDLPVDPTPKPPKEPKGTIEVGLQEKMKGYVKFIAQNLGETGQVCMGELIGLSKLNVYYNIDHVLCRDWLVSPHKKIHNHEIIVKQFYAMVRALLILSEEEKSKDILDKFMSLYSDIIAETIE